RVEEHPRCVPRSAHQLMVRSLADLHGDGAVTAANLSVLHVHHDRLPGVAADRALQPEHVVHGRGEAGNAEGDAVAEEDLRNRPADDRPDAPALEGLGSVLARRATAEVQPRHEDARPLVDLLIERVLGVLFAGIFERVLPEPLERHSLEKTRRDDSVGVDVIAGQRDPRAGDLIARGPVAHRTISRTSLTAPAIAAAATMAGLIKSVRPCGLPCRPMKFRLLDEAHTSRPRSLSSFMPRHIEQPAFRHSKPAARKTSCSPSASAIFATA